MLSKPENTESDHPPKYRESSLVAIMNARIIPGRLNWEEIPVTSPQKPKKPFVKKIEKPGINEKFTLSIDDKEYSENKIPSPTPQVTESAHLPVYAKIIMNTPHITFAR